MRQSTFRFELVATLYREAPHAPVRSGENRDTGTPTFGVGSFLAAESFAVHGLPIRSQSSGAIAD